MENLSSEEKVNALLDFISDNSGLSDEEIEQELLKHGYDLKSFKRKVLNTVSEAKKIVEERGKKENKQ